MNILFLSLAKMEDINSGGIYNDLLLYFEKKGHNVYAVSIRERRDSLKTELDIQNSIHILKVKAGNIRNSNFVEKGLATLLIEQQYKSAIKKYFSDIKFDLVLYATPPITFSNVVKYIKNRDNAKTYLMLKDIFPQNAVDINAIKEKSLIHKYFRRKEQKLYSISNYIGAMSPANVNYIIDNNPSINNNKLEVLPNTMTPRKFNISDEEKDKIKRKYNIPTNKTIYIYGGNLGKPQGINFLIECIKQNENNNDTFMLIVGSGTEYKKLDDYFHANTPQNSLLINRLPRREYEILVNTADVGLIFLDHRFKIPNFPSRLLSYMQASMPVIAATDTSTDVGTIIEKGKFGYWNKSDDVEAFNNNLLKLKDEKLRKKFGENARKYLENNFTSEQAYQIIMKHMKRG